MTVEDEFQIRIGRMRDRGDRAARRGHGAAALDAGAGAPARPQGGAPRPHGGRGIGRGRAAAMAAVRVSAYRRVLVRVKVARAGRAGARRLCAHLAYLTRERVGREGRDGEAFDRTGSADARTFRARCGEDRHLFRIVVSPEEGAELADLRGLTRDLMAQAERDLATRLDWLAVEHWNTRHPHVHLVVRGRDDGGRDLVISPDYISRGLRARAEALVSLELGPKPRLEIARDLQRDVARPGWTALDAELSRASAAGWLALDERSPCAEPRTRSLLIGRAEALEGFGLAVRQAHDTWRLAEDWQARLRALGAASEPGPARGAGAQHRLGADHLQIDGRPPIGTARQGRSLDGWAASEAAPVLAAEGPSRPRRGLQR